MKAFGKQEKQFITHKHKTSETRTYITNDGCITECFWRV